MASDLSARIDRHFASLSDPRRGKVTYPLINILTIALCATIAGADDFVAIADWARQKRDWLGQFLDLSNGIPSHDRFNAVFRALKPGGRFLFLEHGLSHEPTVQKWQHRLNRLEMWLADGCHLDRDMRALVTAEPFASVAIDEFDMESTPRTHGHMYRGVATK